MSPLSLIEVSTLSAESSSNTPSCLGDAADHASSAPCCRSFPIILHEILKECHDLGQTHIASWIPDQPAFKVWDPHAFVQIVLPRFVRQTRYKSFQRQLNLWGFQRILGKTDYRGGYYHPLFVRGRPELCKNIVRQKTTTSATNSSAPTNKVGMDSMRMMSSSMSMMLPPSSMKTVPSFLSSVPTTTTSTSTSALASFLTEDLNPRPFSFDQGCVKDFGCTSSGKTNVYQVVDMLSHDETMPELLDPIPL